MEVRGGAERLGEMGDRIEVEVRREGVNVDHNFRFLHFYTLERSGGDLYTLITTSGFCRFISAEGWRSSYLVGVRGGAEQQCSERRGPPIIAKKMAGGGVNVDHNYLVTRFPLPGGSSRG